MSGFTPGPWVAIDDDGAYEVDADAGMSGCQPICRMSNVFTAKAANTYLIAASPDLYEAARLAADVIEGIYTVEGATDEEITALTALRAALAKSQGEAK